jgi:hypothetical protein
MTTFAGDKEIHTSSRIITIPSPELRQGVRLTVLSATTNSPTQPPNIGPDARQRHKIDWAIRRAITKEG